MSYYLDDGVSILLNLGEVLNSINYNKEDVFQDLPAVTDREYSAFIVNKSLSYFPDAIIQANQMNINSHLDNRMQYHYLTASVRKRKRFSKWHKNLKNDDLELVKHHYNYSNQKAEQALRILTKEQLETIRELHKGESQ